MERRLKLTLYRRDGARVVEYHAAWIDAHGVVEHQGRLGEQGTLRFHQRRPGVSERAEIEEILAPARAAGFAEIDLPRHQMLALVYPSVEPAQDDEKARAVQERLGAMLDARGVGYGTGTGPPMRTRFVVNFLVVDGELARTLIAAHLRETHFRDYEGIWDLRDLMASIRPDSPSPAAAPPDEEEEENLADGYHREGAHPVAVARMPEPFWWDPTDEWAPHGNDAGADALAFFLEWRQSRPRHPVGPFLREQLREHDFELAREPLDVVSEEEVRRLLARLTDFQTRLLIARDNTVVAVAFAQAKREGTIDADVLAAARRAVTRQRFLDLGAERARALDRIAAVLALDWLAPGASS